LQDEGFTRFRRRNNKPSLALADGCGKIDDASGDVFSTAVAALHADAFIGVKWRQVLEQNLALGLFRCSKVDFIDLEESFPK